MPEPFKVHTGVAVPMLRDNIDTDQIIPSREMRSTGRDGLADGLFSGWRYLERTTRKPNPDFVLNKPQYSKASILLAGENFGCGSSREHAVWALSEYGIRAIIAPSFGEIFHQNCVRNSVLPVVLSVDVVQQIAERIDRENISEVIINLPEQTVAVGDKVFEFEIEAFAKRLLVEGLDPISLTLTAVDRISAFHDADKVNRPWIYV